MAVQGDHPRHEEDDRPRLLRRVIDRLTAVGFEHRRISDVRYDVDTAHDRLNSHQVRLDDHHVRLRRMEGAEPRSPQEVAVAQLRRRVSDLEERDRQRQDDFESILVLIRGASGSVAEGADALLRRLSS